MRLQKNKCGQNRIIMYKFAKTLLVEDTKTKKFPPKKTIYGNWALISPQYELSIIDRGHSSLVSKIFWSVIKRKKNKPTNAEIFFRWDIALIELLQFFIVKNQDDSIDNLEGAARSITTCNCSKCNLMSYLAAKNSTFKNFWSLLENACLSYQKKPRNFYSRTLLRKGEVKLVLFRVYSKMSHFV